jgi:predicted nucleic-acid-binding protein
VKKVGIDTNILLRLLIDDNPTQREAVLKFGKGIGKDYAGFITLISLVEMDWALRKQYGFTKRESVEAVRRVVRLRGIEVQSPDAVIRTLQGVENGDGEFADLMIAHLCLDAGCEHVVTLDRKAASRIPSTELLA